jgi:serine/threonine protein kinase
MRLGRAAWARSREAQVLASLNHSNIAHVYGVESGALVMEFVDGEDPELAPACCTLSRE